VTGSCFRRVNIAPEARKAKETSNDHTGFLCPNSDYWLLIGPHRSSQARTKA
jgi:hypothetical protein